MNEMSHLHPMQVEEEKEGPAHLVRIPQMGVNSHSFMHAYSESSYLNIMNVLSNNSIYIYAQPIQAYS